MPQVSMTVNGKPATGEIEGRTLLVEFLRESLHLTGTHVGCDTSQCGACVVHVDGRDVKACTIFAAECEGAEVTTIEGMAADDGTLNKVQQAFQDHHGLQCGFCTPGMVMTAAALLEKNPNPSEEEIRSYLQGISAGAPGITTSSRRSWPRPARIRQRSPPSRAGSSRLAARLVTRTDGFQLFREDRSCPRMAA